MIRSAALPQTESPAEAGLSFGALGSRGALFFGCALVELAPDYFST